MTREEFKAERLKRHHSQASLAEVLGYDKRQIIRWENGEFEIPDSIAYRMRYEVCSWFRHVKAQSGRKK